MLQRRSGNGNQSGRRRLVDMNNSPLKTHYILPPLHSSVARPKAKFLSACFYDEIPLLQLQNSKQKITSSTGES